MNTNSQNPTKPIITAIISNFIIAISKLTGYFFSGSSALLSETIHSFADFMNQCLLYIGIKRGQKEENELFNYGYSQERFFWNLISAMGIFVLGCGVTVYHGVHNLIVGGEVSRGIEQYAILIILFISMIMEGYSFNVALKEIKSQAVSRNKKFFEYLEESLDPSVSAVFWEDLAAIVGILLAFVGIAMSAFTGNNLFDAIASILIGLLMGWIAYHLAIENKKFLIDVSIPEYEKQILISILDHNDSVKDYNDIRTVVLGPDRLKFSAKITLDSEKIVLNVINQMKNKIQKANLKELDKLLTEFSVEVYNAKHAELEKIETQFKERIPALKHVELTTLN